MTHTNHRQGTWESLSKDYVVFMYAAKGINDKDAGPKLQEFLRMGYKYEPVNAGPARVGDMFMSSREKLVERVARATSAYLVFDNKEKVQALVSDVVEADLGLSVIVSGLFDEVDKVCHAVGIKRHTVQCSLGVWGKLEKLPRAEILDITTMCGHGLVSFNLVRRMAAEVSKRLISFEEAGRIMAKPCSCGVFNPKRAEDLLRRYITTNLGG
ncbi:hypothetical protein ACFLYG_04045 [Chloroflexota bacterium]